MKKIIILIIVLLSFTFIAVGFTSSFTESFEDETLQGDDSLTNWEITNNTCVDCSSTVELNNTRSTNGDTSLYYKLNAFDFEDAEISHTSNESFNFSNSINTTLKVDVWTDRDEFIDAGGANNPTTRTRIYLIFDNDVNVFFELHWDQGAFTYFYSGGSGSTEISGSSPDDIWRELTIEIDPEESTVYFYDSAKSPTLIATDSLADISDANNVSVRVYGRSNSGAGLDRMILRTHFDNIRLQTSQVESDNFTLNVDNHMEHGTTQDYEVILNNDDVTNDANITSSNTSVISVDESNNELIATNNNNINKEVDITAEYQEFIDTKTITVSNITIINIEILPKGKYLQAFLGVHDEQTTHGLGSQLQWLLLSIGVGAGLSQALKNEYVGIGTIPALIIMGWLMGYIVIGYVYVSVLFALVVGFLQPQIPGRSDTDVNPF